MGFPIGAIAHKKMANLQLAIFCFGVFDFIYEAFLYTDSSDFVLSSITV